MDELAREIWAYVRENSESVGRMLARLKEKPKEDEEEETEGELTYEPIEEDEGEAVVWF